MSTTIQQHAITPAASREPAARKPSQLRVVWWLAFFMTILNAFVVGYGSVWFQLMGSSADRGDYASSAGGYCAGAVILALGALAALAPAAKRHIGIKSALSALGGAVVLGVAGLASISATADAEFDPEFDPSVAEALLGGVGGVLLTPWALGLICFTVLALVQRFRTRHTRT